MPCRHWQTTNLTTAQIEFIRDCAFFVELAIVDDTLKSFLHDVFLRFFMNWKLSSNPFHVSTGKMNEKMRVRHSPSSPSLRANKFTDNNLSPRQGSPNPP